MVLQYGNRDYLKPKDTNMKLFVRSAPALILALAGCADPSAEHSDLTQTGGSSTEVGSVTYGLTLDDESAVVASYDAPDGRQIKFLEPEPGLIEIMVAGKIGSAPLAHSDDLSGIKPDELYESLSGKKAPSKLVAMSRGFVRLPSETERKKPSAQADDHGVNVSSQALFDFSDSWLFDPQTNTLACYAGQIIVRNATNERDMYQANTLKGGESTVYNTGLEANITGSFKYRNTFTWSSGRGYTLRPNFYVDYSFSNDGFNVKYDIKTYINPHGSSYSACQVAFY